MDCKHIDEAIFLFFDNEMDEVRVVQFREHLDHCPQCARHREFRTRLLLLVRDRVSRRCAPKTLRERILASLPHRRTRAFGDPGTSLS